MHINLSQLLTPRDLSKLAVGQCKYVLITNNDGGILNDPVLIKTSGKSFLVITWLIVMFCYGHKV